MADEKPKKAGGDGISAPIEDTSDGTLEDLIRKTPKHINPHTLMLKGLAPDSKERLAINLEALQHEFGEKKGLQKYRKIARVGGFLDTNQIAQGEDYHPDLSLDGLKPAVKQEVDAILKEA